MIARPRPRPKRRPNRAVTRSDNNTTLPKNRSAIGLQTNSPEDSLSVLPRCVHPKRTHFGRQQRYLRAPKAYRGSQVEKQTDVNLAADLVSDSWRQRCSQAVICSNDSDLRRLKNSDSSVWSPGPRQNSRNPTGTDRHFWRSRREVAREVSLVESARELPGWAWCSSWSKAPVTLAAMEGWTDRVGAHELIEIGTSYHGAVGPLDAMLALGVVVDDSDQLGGGDFVAGQEGTGLELPRRPGRERSQRSRCGRCTNKRPSGRRGRLPSR